MGDRANLIIRSPGADGRPRHLYLQTHWHGAALPGIRAAVLERVLADDADRVRDPEVVGSPAWSEPHFLAGLLWAHGLEYVGAGFGPNDRPPLLLDTASRRVRVYPDCPACGTATGGDGSCLDSCRDYPEDWGAVTTRPAHAYAFDDYVALGLPPPEATAVGLAGWRRVYPEYVAALEAEHAGFEARVPGPPADGEGGRPAGRPVGG
jgi:hypothetical protein